MKKNKILLPMLILLCLGLLAPADAHAQTVKYIFFLPEVRNVHEPVWIGPDGGSIVCLAVDPTDPDSSPDQKTIYAGALSSGVYKSLNGGRTWKSVSIGLGKLFIDSIVVDPKNGDIVYAGTHGEGVYKSLDGGASWFPVNQGIANNSVVYTVAVNPGNHNLVYAGTRIENTYYHGVLYKSNNGGESWSRVMEFDDDWVYSVAVNPSSPEEVLVAIHKGGPALSYDYGNRGTWNDPYPPLMDDYLSGRWIKGRAVAIDPRGWMHRAYYTAWHDGLISYSSDGGISWELSGGDTGSSHIYPNGISIKPNHPDTVYLAAHESDVAGVLRSDDAGLTWYGAGLGGKTIYSVASLGGSGDTVLAGTFMDGVYRSTNGGESWAYSMSGIYDSKVTGLVFPDETTILASTQSGGGVFRSLNGGKSWSQFANNLGDKIVNGLVMHPDQRNIIFALTQNAGLKRIDLNAGSSWSTTVAPSITSPLEIDESGPLGPPAVPDAVELDQVDEPTNSVAALWNNTSSVIAPSVSMAFAPTNSSIVYLGTNNSGVYSSSDSGVNWTYAGQPGGIVRSLAVSPSDHRKVYSATNRTGVIKFSSDSGTTWQEMALPVSTLNVYSVSILPEEPDSLYAGTSNGVYRYRSDSWSLIGLQGIPVYQIGYNPENPIRLYAGTDRGGYLYNLGNATWVSVAGEMKDKKVISLGFNPSDKYMIYFGTDGHGTLKVYLP